MNLKSNMLEWKIISSLCFSTPGKPGRTPAQIEYLQQMKENDKRLNIIDMVLNFVDSKVINTVCKLLLKITVFQIVMFTVFMIISMLEKKQQC